VDTLNPAPTIARFNDFYGSNLNRLPTLYYWFPKLEAFRFFWNAGFNVWLANLQIESTGNSPTNASSQKVKSNPISIFPNPGTSRLTIQNFQNGTQVFVFNMYGRKVYEKTNGINDLEINTSDWVNGVYRIVFLGNGQSKNMVWVKN